MKKILTLFLVLCLAIAMMPSRAFAAGNEEAAAAVFSDDNGLLGVYSSVQEALDAVDDVNGSVVLMLKNVTGDDLTYNGTSEVALVMDNYTYTFNAGCVLNVAEGAVLVVANGTLAGTEGADTSMLINNQGDLMLYNVIVDSVYCSDTAILNLNELYFYNSSCTGETAIINAGLASIGGCVTDASFIQYGGVMQIEAVNDQIPTACDIASIFVYSGSLTIDQGHVGTLGLFSDSHDFTITKAKTGVTVDTIPAGYAWKDNGENDILAESDAVAAIYDRDAQLIASYDSLAEAVAAVKSDQFVLVLKDTATGPLTIGSGKTVVVHLNGHTLSTESNTITVRSGSIFALISGKVTGSPSTGVLISTEGNFMTQEVDVDGTIMYGGGELLVQEGTVKEIAIKEGYDLMVNVGRTATTVVNKIPDGYEWVEDEDFLVLKKSGIGSELQVYNYAKDKAEYSVSGEAGSYSLSLKANDPCKVGYYDGEKIVQIKPSQRVADTGAYVYAVPSDVTEVFIVIIGDANLDAKTSNADSTRIKSVLKGTSVLDPIQSFAADVNGDGQVKNSDSTKIKAVLKGVASFDWGL